MAENILDLISRLNESSLSTEAKSLLRIAIQMEAESRPISQLEQAVEDYISGVTNANQ